MTDHAVNCYHTISYHKSGISALLMRIGFDIGPVTATRTGIGNYCYFLLKHLLDADQNLDVRGFAASVRKVTLGPLQGRFKYRRLPVPTRLMYAAWNTRTVPAVDTLLGGIDVYHATNFYLPPVRRAKTVLTIHDLAFLAAPEFCSPKIVGPFSHGIRRFAARADLVLAVSASTKRDVVQFLEVPEDRIRVTYEAADESIRPVEREEAKTQLRRRYGIEGPFVLFVSTLEPRKNVTTLVKAFTRLAEDFPHWLVLLGSVGWNAEGILKALNDPIISPRIVQPGFVSFDDLSLFYSAADAFALPSHYEGFGLPVLEAMTCGCPVVTSRVSSLPEVGGEAAVYCDPLDEEDLANTLRQVLDDAALRSRMIEAGSAQARRFSWQACAESTLAAYREVVA